MRAVQASQTENYPKALPILRVYTETSCRFPNPPACPNTQITVQIPTERVCGVPVENRCLTPNPPELILNLRANGTTGPDLHLAVIANEGGILHLLNSCDSIFGKPQDCHPLITHADGTLVNVGNPATVGEAIVVYGVGGDVYDQNRFKTGSPAPQSVSLPLADASLLFSYQIEVGFGYGIIAYLPVRQPVGTTYYGQVGGYVGLYQVNLVVPPAPAGVRPCQGPSGVNASVHAPADSGALYFCVKVQ